MRSLIAKYSGGLGTFSSKRGPFRRICKGATGHWPIDRWASPPLAIFDALYSKMRIEELHFISMVFTTKIPQGIEKAKSKIKIKKKS